MVSALRPRLTRRQVLRLGGATVMVSGVGGLCAADLAQRLVRADVVVYGATSAGVVAAVQAGRMGRSAVIVEPGTHLGGMTTGGLGNTDIGNVASVGGIAGEFYRRVRAHHDGVALAPTTHPRLAFAPGVARAVFEQLLDEAGVSVYFGLRLVRATVTGRPHRSPHHPRRPVF
jgi:hypothetical protein